MTLHKDCFAFSSDNEKGCTILKKLYCKGERCKFYKKHREDKCSIEIYEGKE